AAATSQVCDSQFHVAPTSIPSGFESSVLGMAAVSPTDVWAVGITGPSHYNHETLAAHWDGSSWTMVASPHPNAAGVSANLRAVGSGSIMFGTPASRTLIEHYDGVGWSIVPSADLSPTSSDQLMSVSAASAVDIWAVGDSVVDTTHRTLIEHWDGLSWSIVA